MRRRRFLAQAGSVALLSQFAAPRRAYAGSYLNRAHLLLAQARQEADFLRARYGDKELSRIVQRLTRARLEAASRMMVPKEVIQAHPHLLLVFENYERFAEAAVQLDAKRFLLHYRNAQDEERTFRAVLKQLGWDLSRT